MRSDLTCSPPRPLKTTSGWYLVGKPRRRDTAESRKGMSEDGECRRSDLIDAWAHLEVQVNSGRRRDSCECPTGQLLGCRRRETTLHWFMHRKSVQLAVFESCIEAKSHKEGGGRLADTKPVPALGSRGSLLSKCGVVVTEPEATSQVRRKGWCHPLRRSHLLRCSFSIDCQALSRQLHGSSSERTWIFSSLRLDEEAQSRM